MRWFVAILQVTCCIRLAEAQPAATYDWSRSLAGIGAFADMYQPAGDAFPAPADLNRRWSDAVRSGDSGRIATAAEALGRYHLAQRQYIAAIRQFDTGFQILHAMGDRRGMAVVAMELGLAHYRLGHNDDALRYLYNAIDLSGETHLARVSATAQGLAGLAYLGKGHGESGERYIRTAVRAFGDGGAADAVSMLNRTVEFLIRREDYPRAIAFARLGLQTAWARRDTPRVAVAYRNLGIVEFKKSRFAESMAFFDSSLAWQHGLLVAKLKKDACLKLAAYYSFRNEFDAADRYHALYRGLKDSLMRTGVSVGPDGVSRYDSEGERQKVIELLRRDAAAPQRMLSQQDLELSQQLTPAEVERQSKEKALEELNLAMIEKNEREREVLVLTNEKAVQDLAMAEYRLALSEKSALVNALIGGSVIFLLLVFFFYNRYRYKKRAHRELTVTLEKLRSTQEQLVYSQKMASLGELAAGIAHEIKNPLNFVNNFSAFSLELLDELEASGDADRKSVVADIRTNLAKIREHGGRADQIVRNMQLLSRSSTKERQPIDVVRVLRNDVKLAYSGYRGSHPAFESLIYETLPDDLPPVEAGIQDISRVFFNVLSNSFHALHERTEKGEKGYVPVLDVEARREDDRVVVRVRDNGTGIPEAVQDKVFNPFFTTKPAGTGAGLGLSIAFDIVKAHGGEISIESQEGEGTTVRIALPIA